MSSTTTRGLLWEMVAPVVRWPLHSTKRLVGTAIAVVALLMVLSRLGGGDPAQETAADQSPSPTTSTSSSTQPTSTVPPLEVATRFVTAWAKPRLTVAEWYEGILAAGVDDGLAQVLGQTDPTSIPATKIVGTPAVVSEDDTTAQVMVRTDGPTVMVALTRQVEAGWVVSNILPVADEGDDGGKSEPQKKPAKAKPSKSTAAS